MNILALNASRRGHKGFTGFFISQIFAGAREMGAECESIALAGKKMHPCTGCQSCQKTDHLLQCVYHDKDDVAMIFDKMRAADIIVFATPVYTFAMSSLLKILLERYYGASKVGEFRIAKSGLFFHHIDQDICSKPLVILVVCDNLEDETTGNVVAYFNTYARFMDARIVGTLVRKSVGMFRLEEEEVSDNPVVYRVNSAYLQAGRELAASGRINRVTEKKANEPMIKIPFFVKPMLRLGWGQDKITQAHDKMTRSNRV